MSSSQVQFMSPTLLLLDLGLMQPGEGDAVNPAQSLYFVVFDLQVS